MDEREELATLVRRQSDAAEAWQAAELHLLQAAFRKRLSAVGVAVTPDVAVALMATATFLGEYAPEWGGDARCALSEVALLGLELLQEDPAG